MSELWTQLASRAGIELTAQHDAQLNAYLDLLLAGNQRMNLTRITERAQAEIHHIGDALTVLPFLPRHAGAERSGAPDSLRLADVGTGGGVPGIPLAIVRPDLRVNLIESTKKKAAFLEECVKSLGLTNVKIRANRAEDVGQSNLRETFDIAIARAVATLDWLAEWCLPLVKKGGKMLAMKGAKVHEEIPLAARAIKILGGGTPIIHPIELIGTEHHVIVEIPKLGKTDRRYPRPATIAKGKALI